MISVVDLGSSSLNSSNVVEAQCQGAPVTDDAAPDFGKVPLMFGLGFAARPAPANDQGNAQGVVLDDVAGFEAVCVGSFDPRSAQVYQNLAEGDTAVFATGEGFDSQVLFKKQMAAMIVGDDCVIAIDRENKKIAVTGFGATIELSESGIVLAEGGAAIVIKGGTISLIGNVVLGGITPSAPVLSGTPLSPLPSPGVFVGV
jgi:hypothetical protein